MPGIRWSFGRSSWMISSAEMRWQSRPKNLQRLCRSPRGFSVMNILPLFTPVLEAGSASKVISAKRMRSRYTSSRPSLPCTKSVLWQDVPTAS